MAQRCWAPKQTHRAPPRAQQGEQRATNETTPGLEGHPPQKQCPTRQPTAGPTRSIFNAALPCLNSFQIQRWRERAGKRPTRTGTDTYQTDAPKLNVDDDDSNASISVINTIDCYAMFYTTVATSNTILELKIII